MTTLNKVTLDTMKSVELRKVASELKIKNYTKYNRTELAEMIWTLVKPVETTTAAVEVKVLGKKDIEQADYALLKGTATELLQDKSKSDVIRMMLADGFYNRHVIADVVGARYSHVMGVEERMNKKTA